MPRIEKTIFISYRRKDISWALAVYQYLTSQKYDVFFDFSSLSSGDFEQVIISNIRARAHFVLILTPTALDRCSEPGDWLRREIETAIEEKRNIIPLFFDGFNFGSHSISEKLTGRLEGIKRYNGLEIPSGYFMEAMERLRKRYLSVPLTAVILPMPTEVRKVVKEEKIAVNKELQRIKLGKLKSQLRPYGIGISILLVIALGVSGIRSLTQNAVDAKIPTSTAAKPIPTNTITSVSTNTITLVPPPLVSALDIGSTVISPKDGMTLLYVPAGKYLMGSESGSLNEKHIHFVDIDAFWIDRTEVTNAMYAKCVGAGKCNLPTSKTSSTRGDYYGNPDFNNYPVIYVSWEDANAYCAWADRRLPTEAEWEKAARGADAYIYPWGNSAPNSNLLNYGNAKRDTTEVGKYASGASPYGALNMAGNVWEWVNDWYAQNYYQSSSSSNPPGPSSGEFRVLRGGSWSDSDFNVRSAVRFKGSPSTYFDRYGFRCAVSE